MRNQKNLEELLKVHPDFIGFIFYEKSKRNVTNFPQVAIPDSIKKVGVFVNETLSEVLEKVSYFKLDAVQLHGDESPQYCKDLKQENRSLLVLKAFSVDEKFDFETTRTYEEECDLFVFDTKGKERGGNGVKFDWRLLANYTGDRPFLLSGGIGLHDVEELKEFLRTSAVNTCVGVDVNSGFEIQPGLKNIEELIQFKENLP